MASLAPRIMCLSIISASENVVPLNKGSNTPGESAEEVVETSDRASTSIVEDGVEGVALI